LCTPVYVNPLISDDTLSSALLSETPSAHDERQRCSRRANRILVGLNNILISTSVQPVNVTNTGTDLSYRLNAITLWQPALSPDIEFSIKTQKGIRMHYRSNEL
jgi:hypothetical protein